MSRFIVCFFFSVSVSHAGAHFPGQGCFCLRNSIAPPASVPDTQALLSNPTHRITCSRLLVRHISTQHTKASIILPVLWPRFDRQVLLGQRRNHKPAQVDDTASRLRWRSDSDRCSTHGISWWKCRENFLIVSKYYGKHFTLASERSRLIRLKYAVIFELVFTFTWKNKQCLSVIRSWIKKKTQWTWHILTSLHF